MKRLVLLAALALVAAACGKAAEVGAGPTPTPPTGSPSPSPATAEGEWGLRYRLVDHYPNFAFCDPDYYPVAREGGEQTAADDWWGRNRTTPEGRAILAHNHFTEPLDARQRLTAYRDHKKLTVIEMTKSGGGFDYTLSISTAGKGEPDETATGRISNAATITERSRAPRPGGCPICLEGITRIATPAGEIEVRLIRPGDLVYSVGGPGRRVVVRVSRVARRETAGPHLMARLSLADGRVLVAAGAHPVVDGTWLRDLRVGERYDGSVVSSIGYVMSVAPATYDILPASPTGDYWANGVLVGSTLER